MVHSKRSVCLVGSAGSAVWAVTRFSGLGGFLSFVGLGRFGCLAGSAGLAILHAWRVRHFPHILHVWFVLCPKTYSEAWRPSKWNYNMAEEHLEPWRPNAGVS
jgi:hypothetical protein